MLITRLVVSALRGLPRSVKVARVANAPAASEPAPERQKGGSSQGRPSHLSRLLLTSPDVALAHNPAR